jgi:uncharacterized small protein (DUF1192 family)
MRADNSAALVASARDRRADTIERARAALQRLDAAGEPITFSAVACAASVSRAWRYREASLRAEIDRLRACRPLPGPSVPSAQRASEGSLRRRLEAADEEITLLRDENRRLHDQLAKTLGERRVDRTRPQP